MRYLLDTNVLSELRKPLQRRDRRVHAWADQESALDVGMSVISVLELERGVAQISRHDLRQASALRKWLDTLLFEYRHRIINVDVPIARAAASLHLPAPRPKMDSLIAATALVHGLTVVTRNVKDFEPMGVAVLNPWEAGAP